MKNKFFSFSAFLLSSCLIQGLLTSPCEGSVLSDVSFFKATKAQPYHLSVGAVLFDQEGRIACHHFKEIFGHKEIYILMRETMENNETPLMTLQRGLKEEFGAEGEPVAFLGSISCWHPEPQLIFDKTTLYIACRVTHWNPEERDPEDPEASSIIEWLEPKTLIALMKQQGTRFPGIADVDESEMIQRALNFF